jgi:hypothetical protein
MGQPEESKRLSEQADAGTQRPPTVVEVTAEDGISVGDAVGMTREGIRAGGSITPTGALGLAHSGQNNEGVHFVYQEHVEGGYSDSERLPSGELLLTVGAKYPIGRRAEREVGQMLVAHLEMQGRRVELKPGVDQVGEDGQLCEGDRRSDFQVVTGIVAPEMWAERAQNGSASTRVEPALEVGWVREAIEKKAALYRNPEQRSAMIVALDFRFSPLTPLPAATEYRKTFSSPVVEFGFSEVWLVGHAPSYCTQL